MLTLEVLQRNLKHNHTPMSQVRCHGKPEHDIIHPSHCWSKLVAIPQTNQKAKHQAKSDQRLDLLKSFLKTSSQASLSILILSKTDPSKGISSPLTRHVKHVKVLGFLLLKSHKEYILNFNFQLSNSSCVNHSRYAPI